MAGKVLNAFSKGFPGTVSRSVDDIIEALVNADTVAIPFGAPVVLNGAGVKAFASGNTAAQFLGVAVRIAKTNETYGADDAAYQANELVDVLKRGTVSVKVEGTPAAGADVYVTAAGAFTATSAGGTKLTNCKFKSAADANGVAEMVILTRNY